PLTDLCHRKLSRESARSKRPDINVRSKGGPSVPLHLRRWKARSMRRATLMFLARSEIDAWYQWVASRLLGPAGVASAAFGQSGAADRQTSARSTPGHSASIVTVGAACANAEGAPRPRKRGAPS